MKVCTKCGQDKPLDEFGLDRWAKDGHHTQCLQCRRHQRTKRREEHRDRYLEQSRRSDRKRYAYRLVGNRAWQAGHREYMHNSMLRSRYGITLEERQRMYAEQQGKCKICGEAAPLGVDHAHDGTKRVRGLLCVRCNTGIGLFREDVEIMRAAIAYLLVDAAEVPEECTVSARTEQQ